MYYDCRSQPCLIRSRESVNIRQQNLVIAMPYSLVLVVIIFIPTDPVLADDKTLEEQYNFSVKPHILYLR